MNLCAWSLWIYLPPTHGCTHHVRMHFYMRECVNSLSIPRPEIMKSIHATPSYQVSFKIVAYHVLVFVSRTKAYYELHNIDPYSWQWIFQPLPENSGF